MKKANKKVKAAIIIIGNEILSGRTQDVNVVAISNWLNELGVRLEEVRVIPDIEDLIVETINDVRKKFNYVFTTGGIGPTHDDITSRSIAKAFNLSYGYHKEAYKILEKYYSESKVYLQLSRHEAFGVSVVEAISKGCITIVSNEYALPEIVNNYGYTVSSIKETVQKLIRFLSERETFNKQIRLDKFSLTNRAKSFEKLFNTESK